MPLKLVTMKGLKMDNCKVMPTTRKASKTIFLGVWVIFREPILVGAFSVGSFFQGTFYEDSYITHISLDFLFYILLICCKLYAAAVISL